MNLNNLFLRFCFVFIYFRWFWQG